MYNIERTQFSAKNSVCSITYTLIFSCFGIISQVSVTLKNGFGCFLVKISPIALHTISIDYPFHGMEYFLRFVRVLTCHFSKNITHLFIFVKLSFLTRFNSVLQLQNPTPSYWRIFNFSILVSMVVNYIFIIFCLSLNLPICQWYLKLLLDVCRCALMSRCKDRNM